MTKKPLLLFFAAIVAISTFAADYTLPAPNHGWNNTNNGQTITISSWGGGGWYLNNMDCSAYTKVEISISAAAQAGFLDIYYNTETSASTRTSINVGDTYVEATLDNSLKNNVQQIILTCQSGSFTITSAKLTGNNTSSGDTPGITPGNHGFVVSGNQLLDAKNNPFRMMGANFAYTWFKNNGYNTPISQMAAAGANCVRVVLSNGKHSGWQKDGANTLRNIISKCEQEKLVAILEVHDATGSDNSNDLQEAAAYWVEMAGTINGHEHTVIINIANEWMGTWNKGNNYLSAYTTAIQTIRNAGIHHCLMVDAPGWGQDVNTLVFKCAAILQADPDHNTMFSIHMYGTAGAPGSVTTNINNVMGQDVCLVIGEYGWYHTDGDVDEDAIISHCQSVGIGNIAWSWWGNGSELSYLNMVSNQNDRNSCTTVYASNNSCNWGQKVMNSWATQAELCTVYTNAPATGGTSIRGNEEAGIVSSTLFSDHISIAGEGQVSIIDCMGRTLYSGYSAGSLFVATNTWPRGTYLLKMEGHSTVKLMK